MKLDKFLEKIKNMDVEDLSLIIECGIIINKLEKEEQDKLLGLMDVMIKYSKNKKEKTK